VILSAIVAFDFFECGQTKNKVLRGFFKVTYDTLFLNTMIGIWKWEPEKTIIMVIDIISVKNNAVKYL
jgi:hypothetical protein